MTSVFPDAVEVDGQYINIYDMSDAVKMCREKVSKGRGFTFLTLNLDHLVKRRVDASFRAAYMRATFVSADGQPVVELATRSGAKLARTAGADLVIPLCRASEADGTPVFFFGTTDHALSLASNRLLALCPNLKLAGLEAPPMEFDPFSPDAEAAASRIARSGARLCFVALPTVKQVQFMDRFSTIQPHIGFIGVGAALDFIAGTQMRAPRILQRYGLEWFWRFALSPRAMYRRYLDCGLLYLRLRLQPRQEA